jgi:cytochrome c1
MDVGIALNLFLSFVYRRRVGFGDDIVTTSVVNLEGSVPDWGRFIIDSDEEKWERGTLNAGGKADRQRYEEQQKKKEEVKHAAEHFERKSKDINTMEEFIAACDELKSQAGPDGLSIQPMLIATDCKDRDGRPATKFFIYIASVQ